MPAGSWAAKRGNTLLIWSTIAMVLESGWRWIATVTARLSFSQSIERTFSKLSTTLATSPKVTGAPLR